VKTLNLSVDLNGDPSVRIVEFKKHIALVRKFIKEAEADVTSAKGPRFTVGQIVRFAYVGQMERDAEVLDFRFTGQTWQFKLEYEGLKRTTVVRSWQNDDKIWETFTKLADPTVRKPRKKGTGTAAINRKATEIADELGLFDGLKELGIGI
jgi:hypothetical protein